MADSNGSNRRPLIAANWKMHKTGEEAIAFLDAFLPQIEESHEVDVVVCPPYLALPAVSEACSVGPVRVCAQNMHFEDSGAYTGEVSAPMLQSAGIDGAILGHSERRQYFNETDADLARKLAVALKAGLLPILCVGETDEQRDAGETEAVVRRQLEADLAELPEGRLSDVVVAYEPIWAIGTGRTATPEMADEACGAIRAVLAELEPGAEGLVRILYGGSVKPDNASELMGCDHIDGALVGGASLDPDSFAAIVHAAA